MWFPQSAEFSPLAHLLARQQKCIGIVWRAQAWRVWNNFLVQSETELFIKLLRTLNIMFNLFDVGRWLALSYGQHLVECFIMKPICSFKQLFSSESKETCKSARGSNGTPAPTLPQCVCFDHISLTRSNYWACDPPLQGRKVKIQSIRYCFQKVSVFGCLLALGLQF